MADAKKATMDGNTAAAHIAYAFAEVAAIYPITPSSPIGELVDAWAASGKKNLNGTTVDVIEMQSEAGAAGAVHGALSAGAVTTTFTASQGLMLMIPNMHKIAGEMLPTVFYVTARSLAAQSLSIFGDHSDVMSARNTGFAFLACNSVQEVMDLGLVAQLATMKTSIPFVVFFDGFRTSHELQKIEVIDYDTIAELNDPKLVEAFRQRALNPDHPRIKVGQENPDVYFQGRETVNGHYLAAPDIVAETMKQVGDKIGRYYQPLEYVGHPEAEYITIAMGSGCETIEETITFLNKERNMKLGLIKVHLYRPFSIDHFLSVLPSTVKGIAVLDRTKEPGSIGEPLYLDVVSALKNRPDLYIIGGRYGLSSKEFTPPMVLAVYKHLMEKGFHSFTVGIDDDLTHKSLPFDEPLDPSPKDTINCKFWGLGSDGTVGANKNSIKIIGDHTDLYVQGYFQYDSKKSGGITRSHLRFGKSPIKSQYLVYQEDFVACHNPAFIGRFDLLEGIKENGVFLLNSHWNREEVFENLTRKMQEVIINRKIQFYNINALQIAEDVGISSRSVGMLKKLREASESDDPIISEIAKRLLRDTSLSKNKKYNLFLNFMKIYHECHISHQENQEIRDYAQNLTTDIHGKFTKIEDAHFEFTNYLKALKAKEKALKDAYPSDDYESENTEYIEDESAITDEKARSIFNAKPADDSHPKLKTAVASPKYQFMLDALKHENQDVAYHAKSLIELIDVDAATTDEAYESLKEKIREFKRSEQARKEMMNVPEEHGEKIESDFNSPEKSSRDANSLEEKHDPVDLLIKTSLEAAKLNQSWTMDNHLLLNNVLKELKAHSK